MDDEHEIEQPNETPPEEVQEATTTQLADDCLIESADGGQGWRYRIQVIQAGTSHNKTHYPLETLHRRANLYEGVPVYMGRGDGHPGPSERGIGSTAGWLTEAAPNSRGVEATFEVNRGRPDVRDTMLHGWSVYQRTKRLPFGFSHVVPGGKFTAVVQRLAEGVVRRITDFTEVESVDLVTRPSAGGELIGLLAAVDENEERTLINMDELLKRLRAGESLTEAETAQLKAEAPGDYAAALAEAAEIRFRRSEETMRKAECRMLLTATLAEAKLPQAVADHVRVEFEKRGIFEAQELTDYITAQRELAAKLVESLPNTGSADKPEVTQDQTEKWGQALDGFFSGANEGGVTRFRTLREAYRVVTGTQMDTLDPRLSYAILSEAAGADYRPADERLAESIVSGTFAQLWGDSITRRMIREYNFPQYNSWRSIVTTISPISDFRTNRRMRMGGYGTLPSVGQGAPYQNLTSPGDEEATYSIGKYGGLEDLTLEAIANDDVGAIRRIPRALGRAAARTLYEAIWIDTIVGNVTATYDSTALYHSNHGNTGTTALSESALHATENLMRDQTAYGESDAVLGAGNMPRILVIPNELRLTAFKLTQSGAAVVTNEDATTPNMYQGRLQVIVVDEFTDANNWFLFADPQETPMLEVGFFGGREEPELFVQDDERSGSRFTADKVTYKIRHFWGIAVLDHRGTYRQVVT